MNKQLMNIGLCRKAGKLVMGFDSVKESIIKRSAKLVILAVDISPKTKKEVLFVSEKWQIPVLELTINMDEFSTLLHRRVGVFAVIDDGFVRLLQKTE